MQASEGLGAVGWGLLVVLLIAVVVALTMGFTALIYLALPAVVIVFAALYLLLEDRQAAGSSHS